MKSSSALTEKKNDTMRLSRCIWSDVHLTEMQSSYRQPQR